MHGKSQADRPFPRLDSPLPKCYTKLYSCTRNKRFGRRTAHELLYALRQPHCPLRQPLPWRKAGKAGIKWLPPHLHSGDLPHPRHLQEQLSRTIYINKSNVTRQLTFLEQNGFVTRTPDGEDRRIMRVYPTQKALDAYPVVLEVLEQWQDFVMEDFSPEEREELTRLMQRVNEKAAAYAEGRLAPKERREGGEVR